MNDIEMERKIDESMKHRWFQIPYTHWGHYSFKYTPDRYSIDNRVRHLYRELSRFNSRLSSCKRIGGLYVVVPNDNDPKSPRTHLHCVFVSKDKNDNIIFPVEPWYTRKTITKIWKFGIHKFEEIRSVDRVCRYLLKNYFKYRKNGSELVIYDEKLINQYVREQETLSWLLEDPKRLLDLIQ